MREYDSCNFSTVAPPTVAEIANIFSRQFSELLLCNNFPFSCAIFSMTSFAGFCIGGGTTSSLKFRTV
jgi:hypothetical protein